MSDLRKLIDAVEAGDGWSEAQYAVFGNGTDQVTWFQGAFHGSLDAAKALHRALLPGWLWDRDRNGRVFVSPPHSPSMGYVGHGSDPARAWLLAILRAKATCAAIRALPLPPEPEPPMQCGKVQYPLNAYIWLRESTDEWVLEISGAINDCGFVCRHTEPKSTPPEDVAGLPSLYADELEPPIVAKMEAALLSSDVVLAGNGMEPWAPCRKRNAAALAELTAWREGRKG